MRAGARRGEARQLKIKENDAMLFALGFWYYAIMVVVLVGAIIGYTQIKKRGL